MAHFESHGTHAHRPLDQTTSERSLKRAVEKETQQFNGQLFRCANPIMILQMVLTTRDCRSKLARLIVDRLSHALQRALRCTCVKNENEEIGTLTSPHGTAKSAT